MTLFGSGRKWRWMLAAGVVVALLGGATLARSVSPQTTTAPARTAASAATGATASAAPSASAAASVPNAGLWQSWTPPTDLPAPGSISTIHIPPTLSGFAARDAQLYLPPAALVPNAPALPFVLMMMGQPGEPDAGPISEVLDRLAATHNGLAPIVVVADQLGDPDTDSLCLDTRAHGNVETYIQRDVVNWARSNLHILSDRVNWSVTGFSNGGECALSLAAKFPAVWGNVIDASGTAYAGVETEADVLADVFGGDQQSYDATKPETIMAATTYPDTVAVFTVGADDAFIQPGLKTVSDQAQAAGMQTTYYEVPAEGHTVEALTGGLETAFALLYPRLGLEGPR